MENLDNSLDLEIKSLLLSRRTTNALINNGITTVRDLVVLTEEDIANLRGIGETGLKELSDKIYEVTENGWRPPVKPVLELHEWLTEHIKDRNLDLLEQNFGLLNGEPIKAAELAVIFGITTSRTGQILANCRDKLKDAITNGDINPDIYARIKTYAKQDTPLDQITGLSTVYDNSAIALLYAESTGDFEIYVDGRLKTKWITSDVDKLRQNVDTALEWLSSQPGFVPIDELVRQSGVKKSLVLDLRPVKIDGDYIAYVDGYRKDGIDHAGVIRRIMTDKISPVTIDELIEKTGFEDRQVRALVSRMPGVVNVGNSVYALEEYGYSNKDTKELVFDYLKECNDVMHIKDITNYVMHRRVIEKDSVIAAISANPDLFTRLEDGYIALAEWGYEEAPRQNQRYEVPVRDAVLSVLSHTEPLTNREILERVMQKYGEKSTNSIVSIGVVTKKLLSEGIVKSLGSGTIGYFVLN